ncbi:hypothetical protein ACWEKM_12715 [Streptomyces sp. NPDC004752]
MLCDADDLPELLLDRSVPHWDVNELVRLHRTGGTVTGHTGNTGGVRLLEECVADLVRAIDVPGRPGSAIGSPRRRPC